MAELSDVLAAVRRKSATLKGIGEQNTKAALIEPVFRALGWDVEDLGEVQREFKPKPRDKPVDYAFLIDGTPRLFVEAKARGENLGDPRWANQFITYASVAGVDWVVLTDGDEYRIYNAHASVPIEGKLFRSIRISDESAPVEETLRLLSRDQMTDNRIGTLWKAHFVDHQIKRALEMLFALGRDRGLISLVQKHTDLTPDQVEAALRRIQPSLRFEFSQSPPPLPRRPGRKVRVRAQSSGGAAAERARGQKVGVTLAQMIESGVLRPPLELEHTYNGTRLVARVEADGSVTAAGERHGSLSTAAGMARLSVIGRMPRAAKGQPQRRFPQTDGWTFWQFRDGDGELRLIRELRERYLARGGRRT